MVAVSYSYNIPKCIPNGEYLLRIQQLGLHNPGAPPQVGGDESVRRKGWRYKSLTNMGPQFYISCAQIKITNGGSATPSPTALIPGAIKSTDPGYTVNVSHG